MSRLVEITRAVDEEAKRVAAGVTSARRVYTRSPEMAAVIVSEATGGCYSPEDIENSGLPRLMLHDRGKRPLFADADLLALAEKFLDAGKVITPDPRPRRGRKPAQSVIA
jgi:hypothetical protein